MRLILVRHGETIANVTDIMEGQLPGHLSPKGIDQAKRVGRRLRRFHLDVAYVSDLLRTKDTAKEILAYHPKTKVVFTKQLRERSLGIYEGKSWTKYRPVIEKNGPLFADFGPRGGESLRRVQVRVVALYNRVTARHNGRTVLFVSHGGILSALLAHLFGKPFDKAHFYQYLPSNTAVTILDISPTNIRVHTLNCTKHLRLSKESAKSFSAQVRT